MENHDAELETRKKPVMEKKSFLMVELPGYKKWSEAYVGLERIIPILNDYHVLIHPDELNRPLDWFFEREFRDWLGDFAERGAPHLDLNDYKKPNN